MSVYSDSRLLREESVSYDYYRASPSVEITRKQGDVAYQPSSVDLHLGGEFYVQEQQKEPIYVDDKDTYPDYVKTEAQQFHIHPNQFVLATTQETVSLDNSVVGFLWGRSSVGRIGVFAHNAGLLDSQFSGSITLELYNASQNTIVLKKGMRIVQMTVHQLTDETTAGYEELAESKYNGQSGVTPSRLFEDFDNER